MIDAYASLAHFVDHIAPIWLGLPDELRGTFEAHGPGLSRARDKGIRTGQLDRRPGVESRMTIAAAFNDERHLRPRPIILVEHGAGQHYGNDGGYPHADRNPGYPGGSGRGSVCLFLCPNEHVAGRWSEMYPATPCDIVGVPRLDPWHALTHKGFRVAWPAKDALPLVVFSFHWDCPVVPECGWAFPHYRGEMIRLARMTDEERGFRMGGHAHPKAYDVMNFWAMLRVPRFDHFDDVLDQADLYVCDNSSTIYEFASTDRPVVLLNAPWYRRDVEHGLRFWEGADVGIQVDDPKELHQAIDVALHDDDEQQRMDRRRRVGKVYAYTDGHATDRAVAAVVREYEAGYWRAWREHRDVHNPKGAPVGDARLDGVRARIVQGMRDRGVTLTTEEADGLHRASPTDLAQLLADLA